MLALRGAGAMFRDQLADGRHELAGDLHHDLARVFERTLVFVDGLILGLAFVVREDSLDALLVPPCG
jgi:hypothetical protein